MFEDRIQHPEHPPEFTMPNASKVLLLERALADLASAISKREGFGAENLGDNCRDLFLAYHKAWQALQGRDDHHGNGDTSERPIQLLKIMVQLMREFRHRVGYDNDELDGEDYYVRLAFERARFAKHIMLWDGGVAYQMGYPLEAYMRNAESGFRSNEQAWIKRWREARNSNPNHDDEAQPEFADRD